MPIIFIIEIVWFQFYAVWKTGCSLVNAISNACHMHTHTRSYDSILYSIIIAIEAREKK